MIWDRPGQNKCFLINPGAQPMTPVWLDRVIAEIQATETIIPDSQVATHKTLIRHPTPTVILTIIINATPENTLINHTEAIVAVHEIVVEVHHFQGILTILVQDIEAIPIIHPILNIRINERAVYNCLFN